jgi:hypothetical protein
LSETLVTTTLSESLESEPQPDTSESDDTYEGVPEWYRETLDLIIANADVVGPCKWMGNQEERLGTAMWKHTKPTPENVHVVHSNVLEFLANAANREADEEENSDEEEPELVGEDAAEQEQDKTESEQVSEAEKQEAPQKREKTNDKTHLKNETETIKPQEKLAVKTEQDVLPERDVQISERPVVLESLPREPEQSAQPIPAKVELTQNSDKPPASNKGYKTVASKAPAEAKSSSGPEKVSATNEIRPVQSTLIPSRVTEKSEPVSDNPKNIDEQKAESSTPLSAIETPEQDVIEEPFAEMEDIIALAEIAETEEKIETPANPEVLETSDYQAEFSNPVEFEEELPGLSVEVTLESDEIYVISETSVINTAEEAEEIKGEELSALYLKYDSSVTEQAEITASEQSAPISLAIEQVEDTIVQLAEHIESVDLEMAEDAREIINKIIEVPTKLEDSTAEGIITEAEAQEELEELFCELFDKLAFEYTPETIESLAQLTIKWNLTGELEKIMIEESADEKPHDAGTHEIIKKLLAGLKAIKKSLAHAAVIGKSALRLYNFNLSIGGFAVAERSHAFNY